MFGFSAVMSQVRHYTVKPLTDVALAIDLRLDVQNDCDGLQQKFQYAEYFTCNSLNP